MSTHPDPSPLDAPLVASLIGTFLKPEMQSVYRQLTGLRAFRTVVLTERRRHAEEFPFDPVVVMERAATPARAPRPGRTPRGPKPPRTRPRGNFVRRFYYKHLLGVWPPPVKASPPLASWDAGERSAPSRPPAAPEGLPSPDSYNLLPLLAAHRPALLHVYYGHKAVKFLPLLRRWPGPVVVSFHGLDAGDAAYPKFPGGAGEALPAVFAHARLVLARSQSLLDRLAALGCPPEKLRLNRAPVPLGDLSPRLVQPPADGEWRLLQACRLIPKKGLVTTLRAFREVLRAHPAARLTLAGDGPQSAELRATAAELGVAAHVDFAGWCSPERLRELMGQAHVFLHPSEGTPGGDREGVPNSLLEAMATGLPVVATTHGGIPEAVTDGTDGLLVPERDPAALASAALRLMSHRELMKTLSYRAQLNIRANFGDTGQIAKLETCYQEVTTNFSPSNRSISTPFTLPGKL